MPDITSSQSFLSFASSSLYRLPLNHGVCISHMSLDSFADISIFAIPHTPPAPIPPPRMLSHKCHSLLPCMSAPTHYHISSPPFSSFLFLSLPFFTLLLSVLLFARYSDKLRSFLGLCLAADTQSRPAASALLQHPFIRHAAQQGWISPPMQPLLSGLPKQKASRNNVKGILRCILDW